MKFVLLDSLHCFDDSYHFCSVHFCRHLIVFFQSKQNNFFFEKNIFSVDRVKDERGGDMSRKVANGIPMW